MKNYYEVDLANSRDYDYTKGNTVEIAVISSVYPNAKNIENYLTETNSRFSKLSVCNICEIDRMEEVIPFMEEIVDLDSIFTKAQ